MRRPAAHAARCACTAARHPAKAAASCELRRRASALLARVSASWPCSSRLQGQGLTHTSASYRLAPQDTMADEWANLTTAAAAQQELLASFCCYAPFCKCGSTQTLRPAASAAAMHHALPSQPRPAPVHTRRRSSHYASWCCFRCMESQIRRSILCSILQRRD